MSIDERRATERQGVSGAIRLWLFAVIGGLAWSVGG